MRRTDALLALMLCVCTASCTPDKSGVTAPAGTSESAATAPVAVADPAPTSAHVVADPATTGAPTAADARQVVVGYYAAINAHDYKRAYALWGNDGAASGQSFAHFSGGYANTESVEATVGEAVDEEGAAGSRYITVPVELRALQYNGTVRQYRGRFALRAVVANGASPQQRRWHLDSAEMQRIAE